jgi:hypothetical protein
MGSRISHCKEKSPEPPIKVTLMVVLRLPVVWNSALGSLCGSTSTRDRKTSPYFRWEENKEEDKSGEKTNRYLIAESTLAVWIADILSCTWAAEIPGWYLSQNRMGELGGNSISNSFARPSFLLELLR